MGQNPQQLLIIKNKLLAMYVKGALLHLTHVQLKTHRPNLAFL